MTGQFCNKLKLSVFLLSVIGFALPTSAQDLPFETSATYAILIDADNPAIFFEKNADRLMAPASMSKLMTVAMIFRELKAGRLKLTDQVRISVNAWRTGGAPSRTSAMFAPVKSLVSVEDIIRGIIIQSGNDASIAVAEHISGTEKAFAKQMEKHAREIGMKNSSFRNATGLPDPEHLMTARDLAILSRYIIKTYPEYYPYFAEPNFKYRRYNFYNRNPMINLKAGYDGLKTGYTQASKFGIVVSAVRNGRRLIAVLNGLERKTIRRKETQRLMDWAYNQFSRRTVKVTNQTFSARVWGGEESWVSLKAAGPLQIYVLKGDLEPEIEAEVIYNGPVKAPVKQGQPIARLRVKVSNSVQEYQLYAQDPVQRANFVSRAFDSVFYLLFGWII